MSVKLRAGTPADAPACGQICYQAFKTIADRHNFPPDFPSPEVATKVLAMMLAHPGFYGVVAEREGQIVGSNFLDERSPIAGLCPVTVHPAVQDSGIGQQLVQNVLDRAAQRRFAGVRLVQAAHHGRSLALYTKLGFQVREPLATMQGPPIRAEMEGYTVRPASEADLEACNRVCWRVHGHDRGGELLNAIKQGTALVVVRACRITGYTTAIGYFGHAVGETNNDLTALIAAAPKFRGPGFLVPTRNTPLLLWCLERGLRIVHTMTLMSLGLYNEPQGAFLPSIAF